MPEFRYLNRSHRATFKISFLPNRKDFVSHLKHADIGLLPFSKQAVAGKARNKVLDYFACRKLVVSTPEGLRGLEEFHHQEHLLISGYSAHEMVNVVLKAFENLDKYEYLAEAAHTLIRDKHSWNALVYQDYLYNKFKLFYLL
ncbi:hypothetical protein NIES4103_18370 [Nostoc sp. NIES-4103]|nr:hypothetical protein NIES4103_18370 [Nostoc sp. NIES-4103]